MCVKCIIDGGKTKATAKHLAATAESFMETVAAFQDRHLCPQPLTDVEWDTVLRISQEQCDLDDLINDKIKSWNDDMCTIAVAHSHQPRTPPSPPTDHV